MPAPFRFQINLSRSHNHGTEERAKLLHTLGAYQPVPTGRRYPTNDRVPLFGWCICLLLIVSRQSAAVLFDLQIKDWLTMLTAGLSGIAP